MMTRHLVWIAAALLVSVQGRAQDDGGGDSPASEPAATEGAETAPAENSQAVAGTSPDAPRSMSGMSILGNEEAPKALVIVPWKSSELADDLTLSDTLDDRARPVDREVFQRELDYFRLRSGN